MARELLEQLEARAVLEVVRLAPTPGARLSTWRQFGLPREAERAGVLGIHSFTSAIALLEGGLRVQTVHELPWKHGESENAGLAHRLWARVGSRRADRVIVPTGHVARDLTHLEPGRVQVLPWGVSSAFLDGAPEGITDGITDEPFLLCPGAARPKKRLEAVLRGLACLAESGHATPRVVVTGAGPGELHSALGLARRLGLKDRLHSVGCVSDLQLARLLRRAQAVPLLAGSEGFCLPVLEALACGAPVVVPAGGAQAEVAGSRGIVLPSTSPSDVAQGLIAARALGEDPAARADRKRYAARFTWDRAAQAVEQLWLGLR